ncbi:hypothetical protein ACLKA6_002186 [Drosophila palustris]
MRSCRVGFEGSRDAEIRAELVEPRHEIDELCPPPVTCFNGSHGCRAKVQEEMEVERDKLVVGRTSLSHLDSGANKLWRQEVCTNTSDYKERGGKAEGGVRSYEDYISGV